MRLSLIAAVAENKVIGREGKLPWHLPADMRLFKNITMGHHVLMGYGNFLTLKGPLPGRVNMVLTRKSGITADGFVFVNSVDEALSVARNNGEREFFFIGGESIYRIAIGMVDRMYLTLVHGAPDGDRFFPDFDMSQWLKTCELFHPADENHAYSFTFLILERRK